MANAASVARRFLTGILAGLLALLAGCAGHTGGNAELSVPLVVAGGDPGSVCVIEPGAAGPVFRTVHLVAPGRCTSVVAWHDGLYAFFEGAPVSQGFYQIDLATGDTRRVIAYGSLGGLHSLVSLPAGIFGISPTGIVRADPDRATVTTVFPSASPMSGLASVGDELAFVPSPGKLAFLNPAGGGPDMVDLPGARYVCGASAGIVLVRYADDTDRPFSRAGDPGSPLWQELTSRGRSPSTNCDRRLFDIDGQAWMSREGSYFGPGDLLVHLASGQWVRPPSRILAIVVAPAPRLASAHEPAAN